MFDYSILSNEFDQIIEKRNKIKENYNILQTKLTNMKNKYISLIRNNQKKIFIYCLDSFFFQYKILLLELEHYDKVINAVFNRMYGDYYKLFVSIAEDCVKNMFEIDGLTNMEQNPPYKDADSIIEYKTEDLLKLHTNILSIIQQLSSHYENQDSYILTQDKTSDIGFSITSFLDTLGYENRLLYEQINLYTGYLQFHHYSQNGYLDKTFENMETFGSVIDKEILVNHKNAKTESIAKLNIIKKQNYSDSLLDNLQINQKVDTEKVDTEKVDTEKVDTEKVDTEKVDTEKVDTEKVDVYQNSINDDDILKQD
jgi:hypothetical protein